MSSAIPNGSLVLVTGVNGYIGSHIADQLLEAGYRVRGTTRNLEKVKGLRALWEEKHGTNKVEFVVVPDMSTPRAFDDAIKGVSGIAHVASDVSFNSDPHKVIPVVVDGINSILKAAANEPSVKRFVYTSSSAAASAAIPNKEFTIDSSTWNDVQVKEAWAPPPYEPERAFVVYSASKTEGEQALWKFVKDQKPGFVTNSILPNLNLGKILVKGQPASTCGWLVALYNGDIGPLKDFPPQYFVDVQDCARLHVSALTNPDVKNERLFAYASPYTNNLLLRILRKLRPDRKLPEEWTDENVRDMSTVKNERSIELLKKDWGQEGFTSIEQSIKNCIDNL
ncbi:NAD(P)-binding protein [Mollisia scopiformis]|uniref:NAD(P)-binding protein n=1 Tax=Mollisia scopiformis TaxID=149040 RepID=A0A194X9C5_MOLSC|nr:NAD(P)-binding protein [Mollisia scopiformis]KUJ16771.1 NAD(P)-binding protein [Mollisia scopiformis]